MPKLIRLLVVCVANGFLIGSLAALAILLQNPDMPLASAARSNPLLLWLYMFSFGAPFAMGAVATALVTCSKEEW